MLRVSKGRPGLRELPDRKDLRVKSDLPDRLDLLGRKGRRAPPVPRVRKDLPGLRELPDRKDLRVKSDRLDLPDPLDRRGPLAPRERGFGTCRAWRRSRPVGRSPSTNPASPPRRC